MECANETARIAVNAVLERAGSKEAPVTVHPHFRPPELEPLKRIDEDRYRRGQPNLFDRDLALSELHALLAPT
jgi:hypothetical protein